MANVVVTETRAREMKKCHAMQSHPNAVHSIAFSTLCTPTHTHTLTQTESKKPGNIHPNKVRIKRKSFPIYQKFVVQFSVRLFPISENRFASSSTSFKGTIFYENFIDNKLSFIDVIGDLTL